MCIERTRLLRLLSGPSRLTVIEGVAGAGKRTLVAQYLAQQASDVRLHIEIDPQRVGRRSVVFHIMDSLMKAGLDLDQERLNDIERLLTTGGAGEYDWGAFHDEIGVPVTLVMSGLHLIDDEFVEKMMVGFARMMDQTHLTKIILVTFNAGSIRGMFARHDIPFTMIDDSDMFFTDEEMAEFLALKLDRVMPHAVDRLRQATGGIPGVVASVVERFPEEVATGIVTREQAMSSWWTGFGTGLPISPFIGQIVFASRFSEQQVSLLYNEDLHDQFERLSRADMGYMELDPQKGTEVFHWHEELRHRLLSEATDRFGPEKVRQRYLGWARVGALTGDHSLEVSSLLELGDLAAAENVTRQRMWEVFASDDVVLWKNVRASGRGRFAKYPRLALLYWLDLEDELSAVHEKQILSEANRLVDDRRGGPMRRLSRLALAIVRARIVGDMPLAREWAMRWWTLLQDFERTPSVDEALEITSDGLFVVRDLVQMGYAETAASIARHLVAMIESLANVDRVLMGRAMNFARAIVMADRVSGRQSGRDDRAALIHVPAQNHDWATAMAVIHGIWSALDAGDLDEALNQSEAGVRVLEAPEDWPTLIFARAIVLAVTGRLDELESFQKRRLSNQRWTRRFAHEEGVPVEAAMVKILLSMVGSVVTAEGRLDVLPAGSREALIDRLLETIETDELNRVQRGESQPVIPRKRHARFMLEALRALIAGHRQAALAAMKRAVDETGGRVLAPAVLVFAMREEIEELYDIASGDAEVAATIKLALSYKTLTNESTALVSLSARERELLDLIRQGLSNPKIALQMGVSVNTVKFHRSNLYRKLGVVSKDEVLAVAHRLLT